MDVSWLSDWLTWDAAKSLGNSNFFTSFIGALAGAWGGAYAVQRIADRAKRRDYLLQELRTCCAAMETAHGVGNVYAGLKKQHVRNLKARYDEQRAVVHAHNNARNAGARLPEIQIGVDLQRLDVVRSRAAYLETLVLEKMSAPVRARSAAVSLTRAAEQLNECISQRNDLLSRLQAMLGQEEGLARIFGLPMRDGIDSSYGDIVHGIYHYTDDGIHFSRVVCEELAEHGRKIRKAYQACLRRRARSRVMEVPVVIWETPGDGGLIPSKEKYGSWYAGFVSRVPRTHGRWLGKCWYATKRRWRKVRPRSRKVPIPRTTADQNAA
jgi:hypothetical protein